MPDMNDHDEQRITQEYMSKYGINNVRGGPWCKVILSDEEKQFIQKLIDGENDKCYQCGSTDRAKDCKIKKMKPKPTKNTCERCGRFGHSEKKLVRKQTLMVKKIIDEEEILSWECEFCGKEFDTEKGCTFHENVCIVLSEEAKINTEIIINKVRCYKMNYMIRHQKMKKILYVIDVVDPAIYLLNAMPKDTLRVVLYIEFVI